MDKVTPEWIAQQREICDVRIAKMLGKFEHDAYDYNIDGRVLGVNISEFKGYMLLAGLCSEVLPAALDALEASMRREDEKDAEIERLKAEVRAAKDVTQTASDECSEGCNTITQLQAEKWELQEEVVRLTAERDAAIYYVHKDCNSCKWNYGTKPHHVWDACINCGNEERNNWELYVPCAENTDAPTGAESE